MRQHGGVAGLQGVEAEDRGAPAGTSENWLRAMLQRGDALGACGGTDGGRRKMRYTSTTEHRSAARQGETLPSATTDLNGVRPSGS